MLDRKKSNDEALTNAILGLSCAVDKLREQAQSEHNNAILHRLGKIERLLMTQAELTTLLDTKTTQLAKVAKEQSDRFDTLTLRIEELTKIISDGGDVSPALAAAVTNLETALDSLDAAIPDAPTPTP